jgi:hypothetical protein
MGEDFAQIGKLKTIQPALFVFDNGLASPCGKLRYLGSKAKQASVKSHGAFHS